MKFKEMIGTVKDIPEQVRISSNAVFAILMFTLCIFVMSGITMLKVHSNAN
jgi:hypothetical protein